jgi:hypothetical protein
LPEIISNNRNAALQWNHFDCATAAGFVLGHCVKDLYLIPRGSPCLKRFL